MFGEALHEALAVFGRSDLSGVPDPLWWVFMASSGSHVLIGLVLAKAPHRLAWGVVVALVVKEAAFDIPQADGAALVVLDSLADVAAVLIGLLAERRFWRKPRSQRNVMNGKRGKKRMAAHTANISIKKKNA